MSLGPGTGDRDHDGAAARTATERRRLRSTLDPRRRSGRGYARVTLGPILDDPVRDATVYETHAARCPQCGTTITCRVCTVIDAEARADLVNTLCAYAQATSAVRELSQQVKRCIDIRRRFPRGPEDSRELRQ